MSDRIQPLCRGGDCKKKLSCYHYSETIDYKKQQYFSKVPWDEKRQKCEHYFGVEDNGLLQQVKSILDERKKTKDSEMPHDGV